ncbi:MAG: tetraacyldisaccharide 4'-kinase [Alphaproteobacteria bacterium]|nr:tetraacyldisaccharide 4'-kinase [Alphaproteobacteria bacterium]
MRAPAFWSEVGSPIAAWLDPLGRVYHGAARLRRALTRAENAPVPVLCVGNLVAGGAGKTPTAIAVMKRLRAAGLVGHFLSRGYGGGVHGPHLVDAARDRAGDVGDEPLLLARKAPTWVARDRPAGARFAIERGAKIIVMDDGFQNPSLRKDLSLVVVDAGFGFGNGRLIPAGPLREPVAEGLARAQAIVLIGEGAVPPACAASGLPVLRARLAPVAAAERLAGKRVLAFAGIARPDKFFATLRQIGCDVVDRVSYQDHHPYAPDEIMRLAEKASALSATPVTTEKDHVRLPPEARAMVEAVGVELAFDEVMALDLLFRPIIAEARGK